MENLEAVLTALGIKLTKGGAVVSFAGWLASSAAAAWFGAGIAACGLLVNWHFNRKRDKREQEEHEARMKGIGNA